MKKPFILYDASLDSYVVGKGLEGYIFGPKKKARRFATSALATVTARAISHKTGRFINIKKSFSAAEKRGGKKT